MNGADKKAKKIDYKLGIQLLAIFFLIISPSYLVYSHIRLNEKKETLESGIKIVDKEGRKKLVGNFITDSNESKKSFNISYSVPKEKSCGHYYCCLREAKNKTFSKKWKPNCSEYFKGEIVSLPKTKIEINSDGFRGREFSEEKPEDVYRIETFGDAFTFVLGLNNEESWPYKLEENLNSYSKGKEYQVLNFAVPGEHVPSLAARFKSKGLKYDPDLVIVQVLGRRELVNDSKYNKIKERIKKRYESKNSSPTAEYAYFETITDNIYFSKILNDSREDIYQIASKPLKEIIEITKKRNISLIFATMYSDKIDRKIWSNLADKKNSTYIDLEKRVYSQHPKELMEMRPQYIHPTEYACDKISDEMLQVISKNELLPHLNSSLVPKNTKDYIAHYLDKYNISLEFRKRIEKR